jgi:hypothetical protein
MIPSIAVVHVHHPHWRTLRLWLPLFLLWIPTLFLAPLVLLVLLIVCLVGRVSFFRAVGVCWAILSSLPGTDVRVSTDGNRILVRIL